MSRKPSKSRFSESRLGAWALKHRRVLTWISLFALFLLSSYLFYKRFPNNFSEPNFYSEDGTIFIDNLIHNGLIGSLLTTFNGYFVWGIYILGELGLGITWLLGDNEFTNIPRALALVSYAFLGFTAILPVLLFRKYFKIEVLLLIALLTTFVPLVGWDYAVIGTLGNLKFVFVYIAFLLLIYRHLLPEGSKKIYVVDAALVVCAFTNVTVYPMLLFALLRYIPLLRKVSQWKQLLTTPSFISSLVLGVILLSQLIVIYINGRLLGTWIVRITWLAQLKYSSLALIFMDYFFL